MNSLNFNHLYNFFVIASEGSIIKACKKLHITQSTLSTQLKNLEDFFGKKLFDRKVRKLLLNDDGKLVFEYASQIFNLSDELVESLKQQRTKKITTINIGVVPTLPKSYVHEFTLPLWKNKNVIVRTKESPLTSLLRELEMGMLDIILSDMEATTIGKKIVNSRIVSKKIIVAAHPKYSYVRKNFPKSLNGLPFINYTEETYVRGEVDEFFKSNDITPEIIGEVDDTSLLRLTAQKGHCFIVIPENAIKDSLAEKKLIKLGTLDKIETGSWAITRSESETPEIISKSIKSIIQQL